MGNSNLDDSHCRTRKIFLFTNYILIGVATSCIFLTLSLRLIPSLVGLFFILLHLLTIAAALFGCAVANHRDRRNRWFGAHMTATILTAIFQGSLSVLILTRPDEFLEKLKSYVREDDGVVILKLTSGLCVVVFAVEWVALTVGFLLKYKVVVEEGGGSSEGMKRSAKVQGEEELGYLPYPSAFQV